MASKWSRHTYEKVAEILHAELMEYHSLPPESESSAITHEATIRSLASKFAMTFAKDNPRFSADKFLDAVGFLKLTAEEKLREHGIRLVKDE